MASLFKHKRTTLERIDKYISDIYFTDVNIFGKIYPESSAITEITHYAAPDRVPFSEVKDKNFESTKVGTSFGPTWATHWFKLKIDIPSKWKGSEVHLRWNSDSEAMICDISGNTLQGLSGNTRDKSYYKLCSELKDDNGCHILFIEMACNDLFGAGNGSTIAPPDENRYYQLKQCDIALFDKEVYDIWIDLGLLHDLTVHLPDEDPRGFTALYTGNNIINLLTKNPGRSGYAEAKKILDKFFSEKSSDSDHILHAIGHCHIDTAWLWPYAETIRKCARSWSSAIQLMKLYPKFTFACSQAQQYQWIKEKYPDLFEEIKSFVQKQQFLPVGSTWVEMDGNIPSGESFIRQFLYGQKFFNTEFGMKCKELWLPDTFGYSAQLPQIMNICGITRFLTQKLSWSLVNKFPHHNFVWQGIDGSTVLVHFPPGDSYEMNVKVDEVLKTVKNLMDKGRVNDSMMLYGYGDGGGGPSELMLKRQRRLENTKYLPQVKLSTPDTFFEALESDREKLCRWVGELFLELHQGTYTTHHKIKQENRSSEYSLRDAEYLSSICFLMSGNDEVYPAENLENAWKKVLLNQFHDVLPGSSIGMVYEDAHRYYAEALGVASEISQHCMELLFGQANNRTIIVNSLSWDRVALVPIDGIMLNNLSRNNSGVHHQDLESGKKLIPVHIPATGYIMVTELQPIKHCVIVEKLPSGLYHMKNEFLDVFLDAKGRITSLKSFENDMEVVPNGEFCNQFVTFSDIPLYWDAWDVMDYHLETREIVSTVSEEVRIVETGPLRASISVKLQISSKSYIEQKISLDVAHPYVSVDLSVSWFENHKFLKVEFPVNIHSEKATYDIQFGHIQRPTHYNTSWDSARYEVCGHKWSDLSEHDWGVSILNDSCYGHSIHGNVMRMSLLRSPKSPDANADMGLHHFTYAIYPHKGSIQSAKVIQHSYELNIPVKLLSTGNRLANNDSIASDEFTLMMDTKHSHSWFTISNPAIILETVKRSENKTRELLLRLYECYGAHSSTELKTSLPLLTVQRCNALEDPIESSLQEFKQQSISLTLKPFEIVSLLVTF